MTLTDLIKSAEEKLANHDMTLGTRRREEAILHHLTNLERTVTELESQNNELYLDLCEMGEMARAGHTMNRHNLPDDEPKTERVHLYTDDTETQQFFLGGHKFYELTIDKMIRHKWPEEKPMEEKQGETTPYLLRLDDGNGAWCQVYHQFGDGFGYIEKYITHWWNLPEVTE